MILLVGLGNRGSRYERTPHNLGFRAVERLRPLFAAGPFSHQARLNAAVTRGMFGREKILLAQPTTMMNASGEAVQKLLQLRKIPPQKLWVIHDELDLPLGTVRHSFASRAAGNRGVQSIIDAIGTNAFHRIRLGINTEQTLPAERYVLKAMTREHLELADAAIAKLADRGFADYYHTTLP